MNAATLDKENIYDGNKDVLSFPKGRAWIEVDRRNLQKNVSALTSLLPKGCLLCPALKANAYGHGAVIVAKELNSLGINDFCVATALEGKKLRENDVKGEILVLGYTHPKEFPLLWKYHLTQTIFDYDYARALDSYGRKTKVQIKIDTGMHRLGEDFRNIEDISRMLRYKHLSVTGIFTHLCAAETRTDRESAVTYQQREAFYQVVSVLEGQGFSCGKKHLLASCGLINFPELGGDYARIGIALYGVLSERRLLGFCSVKLYPVLSLKARVTQVRNLYKGENVGYGLHYTVIRDSKIAVLAIGYADGIPCALSNGNGSVLIKGKKAAIIGRMCMDQMFVDVTEICDVKSGDIATLIGRDGEEEISVYDLAEAAGTVTMEILSRMGSRLERILN